MCLPCWHMALVVDGRARLPYEPRAIVLNTYGGVPQDPVRRCPPRSAMLFFGHALEKRYFRPPPTRVAWLNSRKFFIFLAWGEKKIEIVVIPVTLGSGIILVHLFWKPWQRIAGKC